MIRGRRQLLALLAALPVMASGSTRQLFTSPDKQENPLQGLLHETVSAQIIGRAYLDTHPAEADTDLILASIFNNKSEQQMFSTATTNTQRRLLGKMVQTDFELGRLVTVNGWLLSQTEARIYAITSLVS